jgi:hypothetical protein
MQVKYNLRKGNTCNLLTNVMLILVVAVILITALCADKGIHAFRYPGNCAACNASDVCCRYVVRQASKPAKD